MKKMVILALMSLLTNSAFGATVNAARLDAAAKNILIDVTYGGGCGDHKFSLEVGACAESFPVKCTAKLIEKTNDVCEGLISNTVVISLEKYGLTKSYYKGASLKITGDIDWKTNRPSQVDIKLP